jgi:hypothetical protein
MALAGAENPELTTLADLFMAKSYIDRKSGL